ncbi:MAG: T9SS type A sorting domain-containing protein [Bacteroidia bacterium]|nr:T9SS type A sorting domain-containing protein [Bacteroidia bacterium]MDW8159279.1 T9SS type A sorting domain-containing protein [Bacteroidia bacterium]
MNKKKARAHKKELLVLAILLLVGIHQGKAQSPFWHSLRSLGGGDVYDLLPINNQVWAATNRGVYITSIYYPEWVQQTDNPLMQQYTYQLIASSKGTVFANTQNGIFRYQAGTWSNITKNLPTHIAKSLGYLEGVGLLVLTSNFGIFRFSENISQWEPIIIGEDLGAEPTLFSHLYCDSLGRIIVVEQNRLYISEDSAKTWKKNVLRLDENGAPPIIYCVASRKAGYLLLGTSTGIWEATEPTLTNWQKLGKLQLAIGETLTRIGYLPQAKIYYAASSYGQIFQLSAPYENLEWQPWLNTPFANAITCAILPSNNQIWFGTESNGVWAWDFNNGYWRAYSNGLTNASITAICATSNAYFAKLSGAGLWTSRDKGITWQASSLPNEQVQCFLTHQDTIWVGVLGNGGVWRSFDGGRSWQKSQQWAEIGVRQLLRAPNGEIYALTFVSGIWYSRDKGVTWQPLPNQEIQQKNLLCFAITSKGEIIAGCQNSGVYQYQPLYNRWRALGNISMSVQAILSTQTNQLLAATSGGIYLYAPDKDEWVHLFSPPGLPTALLQTSRDSIWIATIGGGVWVGNMQHWYPVNEGLSSLKVSSLCLTPQNEILAGTLEAGLYRSQAIKITNVTSNYAHSTNLKIYPNPASDFIQINSPLPLPEKCLIELFSTDGTLKYHTYFSLLSSQDNFTITLTLPYHLQTGIYHLRIRSMNSTYSSASSTILFLQK